MKLAGDFVIFPFCGHGFSIGLYGSVNEAKAIIAHCKNSSKTQDIFKLFEEFDAYVETHSDQPFVLDDYSYHHRILVNCSDYGYCNSTALFSELFKRYVPFEEYIRSEHPETKLSDDELSDAYSNLIVCISTMLRTNVTTFIDNRKGR